MSSFFLHASSWSGAHGSPGLEVLDQGRAVAFECLLITLFVIGGTVLPATVKDANPLEGQGAEGSVVFGSLLDLLLIIGLGPRRPAARVGRELMKGPGARTWDRPDANAPSKTCRCAR